MFIIRFIIFLILFAILYSIIRVAFLVFKAKQKINEASKQAPSGKNEKDVSGVAKVLDEKWLDDD